MEQDRQTWSFESFVVITIAYVAVYSLMEGIVAPLQKMVAPELSQVVSLLFLPHGIRVLTLYYFGWRGIYYLVPGSLISWFLMVYGQNQPLHLASSFVSLLACYLGVSLVRAILGEREASFTGFSWRNMLAAGFCASLLNSAGLSLLHFDTPPLVILLGYVFGDVMGQAVLMIILIFIFKAADKIGNSR